MGIIWECQAKRLNWEAEETPQKKLMANHFCVVAKGLEEVFILFSIILTPLSHLFFAFDTLLFGFRIRVFNFEDVDHKVSPVLILNTFLHYCPFC